MPSQSLPTADELDARANKLLIEAQAQAASLAARAELQRVVLDGLIPKYEAITQSYSNLNKLLRKQKADHSGVVACVDRMVVAAREYCAIVESAKETIARSPQKVVPASTEMPTFSHTPEAQAAPAAEMAATIETEPNYDEDGFEIDPEIEAPPVDDSNSKRKKKITAEEIPLEYDQSVLSSGSVEDVIASHFAHFADLSGDEADSRIVRNRRFLVAWGKECVPHGTTAGAACAAALPSWDERPEGLQSKTERWWNDLTRAHGMFQTWYFRSANAVAAGEVAPVAEVPATPSVVDEAAAPTPAAPVAAQPSAPVAPIPQSETPAAPAPVVAAPAAEQATEMTQAETPISEPAVAPVVEAVAEPVVEAVAETQPTSPTPTVEVPAAATPQPPTPTPIPENVPFGESVLRPETGTSDTGTVITTENDVPDFADFDDDDDDDEFDTDYDQADEGDTLVAELATAEGAVVVGEYPEVKEGGTITWEGNEPPPERNDTISAQALAALGSDEDEQQVAANAAAEPMPDTSQPDTTTATSTAEVPPVVVAVTDETDTQAAETPPETNPDLPPTQAEQADTSVPTVPTVPTVPPTAETTVPSIPPPPDVPAPPTPPAAPPEPTVAAPPPTPTVPPVPSQAAAPAEKPPPNPEASAEQTKMRLLALANDQTSPIALRVVALLHASNVTLKEISRLTHEILTDDYDDTKKSAIKVVPRQDGTTATLPGELYDALVAAYGSTTGALIVGSDSEPMVPSLLSSSLKAELQKQG